MASLRSRLKSVLRRHRWKRRVDVGGAAILWWGSLPDGGGATIGDLHAVDNLSAELRSRGHSHTILTHPSLNIPHHRSVPDLFDIRRGIKTLVFVCGPIVEDRILSDFLSVHNGARKIAVGVSVLPNHAAMAARFDAILARDGLPVQSFDLAISAVRPCTPPAQGRRIKAALCFRGDQSDYGKSKAQWLKAEGLLTELAGRFGLETFPIDTVLRPGNDAARIEQQFAEADVVLTTRLHGSLFGLASGKPVIAIDQIVGAGKVKPMLSRLAWPAVYGIDEVDAETLAQTLGRMVEAWPVGIVSAVQQRVQRAAKAALRDAASLVIANSDPEII